MRDWQRWKGDSEIMPFSWPESNYSPNGVRERHLKVAVWSWEGEDSFWHSCCRALGKSWEGVIFSDKVRKWKGRILSEKANGFSEKQWKREIGMLVVKEGRNKV